MLRRAQEWGISDQEEQGGADKMFSEITAPWTNQGEKLKLGEDYIIVDRFLSARNDTFGNCIPRNIIHLEYDVKYLAKVDSIRGVYHTFGRITREAHLYHCFLRRFNSFEDYKYSNLIMFTSIKEGDFKVESNRIITNPLKSMVLFGFDDEKNDVNADICKGLLPILKEVSTKWQKK